jgi:actin related protein 2/3 complex subunit 2
MIILEVENRAVEESLLVYFEGAAEKGKFEKTTTKVADFDGCIYSFSNVDEARTKIQLTLEINFLSELVSHGAIDRLQTLYGEYFAGQIGENKIALEYDISKLPSDPQKVAKAAARLKRNCFAAVFEKYFEAQKTGSAVKRAVIHYREGESMYVEAKSDRVTVIFSTLFKSADDIVIGNVFLQEFKEGRRASATAPQVLFSCKEPPIELRGTDAKSGDNVGYITFVLLPRHFNEKTVDSTIDLIHTFRNYLHYHIKCSKVYIQTRMRQKTNEFLQVLNRARPDSDKKAAGSWTRP